MIHSFTKTDLHNNTHTSCSCSIPLKALLMSYYSVCFSQCTLLVGSHNHRSLQLVPKMHYYLSPTLRSETVLPLKKHACMLKTTTPCYCNRWKIFLSILYPHFITFCFIWQHHDMLQTSAIESKNFRIGPKSCILLQLFEVMFQKLAYC